ncbi:MAG: hypothetical protein LBV30_00130 [Propionibacteriaceae bacterium]|jgi:hypothetical protein|nr:hypothetical protein [Propionibacteriaceae bacterium]
MPHQTPQKPIWRPAVAALALAGLLATVSACGSQDDLPTLGGSQSTNSANELVAIAADFQSCLAGYDIKVELQANGAGEMTAVGFDDKTYEKVLYNDAEGIGGVGGSTDWSLEANAADFDRLYSEAWMDGTAHLEIDGVDRSADWTTCLDQSGFSFSEAFSSENMPMDAEQVQLAVEANNRWAACAREHGFPNIADSQMPTDLSDFSAYPMITLPITTDPVALQQLLVDCPNFDPDAANAANQWYTDHPEGGEPPAELVYTAPAIDIDTSAVYPTGDSTVTPSLTPQQQELEAKYNALIEVLYAAMNDYFSNLGLTETAGGDVSVLPADDATG